ncbi:hypothetical protein C1H46_008020 [Malus baccata]|uniref:Uncharacterized protein n=1 Tax=Malus baccata TaxID=106549 RepID=A0A540N5R3_MALBA|nr:hypothetical protein C1H46_008020 [Malus baccata]
MVKVVVVMVRVMGGECFNGDGGDDDGGGGGVARNSGMVELVMAMVIGGDDGVKNVLLEIHLQVF